MAATRTATRGLAVYSTYRYASNPVIGARASLPGCLQLARAQRGTTRCSESLHRRSRAGTSQKHLTKWPPGSLSQAAGRLPRAVSLSQLSGHCAPALNKDLPAHSPLIPSCLMIGHHFSASAFCNWPSASGVCRSRGKISSPRSASRDRTAGSAKACTVASLSRLIMSFGVPFGAIDGADADPRKVSSAVGGCFCEVATDVVAWQSDEARSS